MDLKSNVLAFDLGGSSVKYGIVSSTGEILYTQHFPTITDDFNALKNKICDTAKSLMEQYEFHGIAFSCPGTVDEVTGTISGLSAIPCIHGPKFYEEFSELGLPITLENDANCAALAETWCGASSDVDNSAFIIIGTGIGGAIIKDKKLHKGKNRYGGEFGYMIAILDRDSRKFRSFSHIAATKVLMDSVYERTGKYLSGKEIFDQSELYQEELDEFFFYNAVMIYNIQYSYDPERIVIGGGVSANEHLLEGIKRQFIDRKDIFVGDIPIDLVIAKHKNDANLIGAVYHFLTSSTK